MTLVCALLISACATDRITVQPRDAEVYAAALDSLFFAARAQGRNMLVLDDSTRVYARRSAHSSFWTFFDDIAGAESEMVEHLERRAQFSYSVRPIEDTPRTLLKNSLTIADGPTLERIAVLRDSLIRNNEHLPGIRTEAYWKAFYAVYPRSVGSVSLSAVGYNRARNAAVLLVEVGCGGLCGEGQVVLLRRMGSRWRVERMVQMWVS